MDLTQRRAISSSVLPSSHPATTAALKESSGKGRLTGNEARAVRARRAGSAGRSSPAALALRRSSSAARRPARLQD